MLFLVLLIKSLIFALIAFAVGAAASLLLWVVGLITRVNIPAVIRWGAAGVSIAIYAFGIRPDLLAETEIRDSGWRSTAEGTNQFCVGLACVALFVVGFIISVTKLAVKGTVKGVKAINAALDEDQPQQPQQPPPLP